MSEFKPKDDMENKEKDIVFSKAIKAGKRIYYLDVKQSQNGDYYVSVTESKKRVTGYNSSQVVSFEKHKIFLYPEDFNKFMNGLEEVMGFIEKKTSQNMTSHPEDADDANDY
jgi:hypothetical protein